MVHLISMLSRVFHVICGVHIYHIFVSNFTIVSFEKLSKHNFSDIIFILVPYFCLKPLSLQSNRITAPDDKLLCDFLKIES